MSVIQIFGLKNCNDSRKAQRFFKERGKSFQFINLQEKGMSKGELQSVQRAVGLESLIDTEGKQFKKRNMEHMDYDAAEELLEDPLLFKTPVVRRGAQATAGYVPEVWQQWLKD